MVLRHQWCIAKNKDGYTMQAVWTRRRMELGVVRGCAPPLWGPFLAFFSQNGEFWCILGRIFRA